MLLRYHNRAIHEVLKSSEPELKSDEDLLSLLVVSKLTESVFTVQELSFFLHREASGTFMKLQRLMELGYIQACHIGSGSVPNTYAISGLGQVLVKRYKRHLMSHIKGIQPDALI